MEIRVKSFFDISRDELYALLEIRSKVFVVEQKCPYNDLDNKDQKASHCLGYLEDKLVAYSRVFLPGDYFESAAIGRVVVCPEYRGSGLGHDIFRFSINILRDKGVPLIQISAQQRLKKFYTLHGFKRNGAAYLEDGIPHIAMYKTLKNNFYKKVHFF